MSDWRRRRVRPTLRLPVWRWSITITSFASGIVGVATGWWPLYAVCLLGFGFLIVTGRHYLSALVLSIDVAVLIVLIWYWFWIR
jgi:hypothetical protein